MSTHPNKDSNSTILSLTLNEKKVLEHIELFMAEHGIAPTYNEIKNHFGFASFNSVQRYLKQLQAKGYIGLPGGNQKRAIVLLKPASALKEALQVSRGSHVNSSLDRQGLNTIGAHLKAYDGHSDSSGFEMGSFAVPTPTEAPAVDGLRRELLSLPLLGKVAAGRPLEALHHQEFTEVPPNMVRYPGRSFTLEVSGNSMIEDGIFNGDVLIVQEQRTALNGEISVCVVDNEATVKRFYLHSGPGLARPQVELRPANSELESMWYEPDEVQVKGIVIGLLRKF